VTTPNIRPTKTKHGLQCQQQEFGKFGIPGDVRRCPHGKVQVLTQVPDNARVQGPGTHWWRTLSPFWDWRTYRLALEVLEVAGQ
jgi:hypothetical protein